MYYILSGISFLLMVVGVLITVAFLVLLERSVLGYIQLRKGPNKVGLVGVLQSFSDAIKLFMKEQLIPSFSNIILFFLSPLSFFSIVLFTWMLFPSKANLINLELGGVLFLCSTSLSVYSLMFSGWASNSNYAMLGAMRGVAQTISYEVSLSFFFLSLVSLLFSLNLSNFSNNQQYLLSIIYMVPVFMMWSASMLAETNRSPFDFAEGESELVSGFNVEYGSSGFALLFLAEYGSIIFMSYFMMLLFFGGFNDFLFTHIGAVFFCFVFIWVRGTYPRFRYDKLMFLAWKSFLPASLCYFVYFYYIAMS